MAEGNGTDLRARPTRCISPLNDHEPIAVIGIGCRFPGGANGSDRFWKLLAAGVDAVTEIPPDRWNVRAFHDPDPSRPGKTYSRWGGFVEDIDKFDPRFFGISPREAARMDPQQRLLLEVSYEGLEDAGLPLENIAGSQASVFVGISSFDYSLLQTSFRDRGEIDVHSNTGGSLSIAANRISYCYDFRGPSAAVDTACSSALVAVHLACRSIWQDGCPLALAGGVNVLLLPDWYVGFCRMGMLSPNGRCRAFDAAASGFVRSEGAGVVVLKPLAQALADGDRVYATIRGTAMNQDGRTPGMIVPSQEAQEELLRSACRDARVRPRAIQYVEAHGTGTLVGDPIEAQAIGHVFGKNRPENAPCLIGSVKTNIGHLEAGAGIAGLIKVALALYHQQIPANLHFERPSPAIDFDSLRLRVPTGTEAWPGDDGPSLAGVNAFGFGGTNAHVILEGPPHGRIIDARRFVPPSPGLRPPSPRWGEAKLNGHQRETVSPVSPNGAVATKPTAWASLVPLSARDPDTLRTLAGRWIEFLGQIPNDVSLETIAASAALRRSHHDHRLAVVARSKQELIERLQDFSPARSTTGIVAGRASSDQSPRLAFVCSGQGPQWWAMGRQLLQQEPTFRAVIDRCDAIVRSLGDWSLIDELTASEFRSRMNITAISQPCIFALQVGLAELWASWGVRPEALIGHSVGEVAAAYLAGVFSLEDAVRIIYHRGRTMELAPERGRMLAAAISPDAAARLIPIYGERIALAAVNGPNSVTLSGEAGPLESVAGMLEAAGTFCRLLKVEYAFHSAQMDPIRDELLAALEGIKPQPARLPLVSTVTGGVTAGQELGPEYWWNNVRRTVCFADGVARLIALGCDTAIELSPHPVLAAALNECYQQNGTKVLILPSLRRNDDERATLLHSLASLYVRGYPVDWPGLVGHSHEFLPLPTYPWRHEQFWHESGESRVSRLTAPAHPLLGVAQGGPRPGWEARLDLRGSPYLGDHCIQHAAIVPATAYLELAFAAGREAFGTSGYELRDVKLANPCFLAADRPLRLQTLYDAETGIVQVHTCPVHGDHGWTIHLTASLRSFPAGTHDAGFLPGAIVDRCSRQVSREQCYAYFTELGLDYGPMFRGIERAWQGDGESLALVSLPEALEQESGQLIFPPALLDACLQAVIPADRDFDHRNAGLYLPHEIDSVQLFRTVGRRVWVHARLLKKTLRRSLSDVDIFNEDQQLVARLRGLRSQRVASGRDESLDGLLYAYEWRRQPRSDPGVSSQSRCWIVFADANGVGSRLANELRARGDRVTIVRAGSRFVELDGGDYLIDPSQPDDMLRMVGAAVRPDQPPCSGIIHLWNLDAPAAANLSAETLRSAQELGLLSIVWLVQAWDRVAPDQLAQLFLVTRGAQSVADRPEPVALAQAPVIGLGRVIASECPRLQCRLVDLDPADDPAWLTSLVYELDSSDNEDEIALRGAARFVHRFVPAPGLPSDGERGPVKPGAAYRLAAPRPGTLDGLELQSLRRRPPGPGEVEIEVVAAGLNFSDVMKGLETYPGLPDGPVPLGAECSGRITAVGPGVDRLREGDRVLAVAGFAFGSHVVTRAEMVAIKPAALSFEQAAALPIAFLTAAYALEYLGRLERGERVLIHSATGGVGLAAIQIARRAGAEVYATAGSAEKREHLRALGIDCVMDSRSLDFAEEVLERTGGRGVDVILNSLPGEAIARGLASLADYGRFLEIGKRDIYQNTRLGLQPFHKNLSLFAIDLDRVIRERPGVLGTLLTDIVRRVADGELEPLPIRTWPISEAVDAFRFMQQAKHIGKVVLMFGDQPVAPVPAEDEPLTFRGDASYLITGGLGGFGLAVARWMAERGAGTLVLVGRRGAQTPEVGAAVAEIERLGARVVVHAADVAKEADVGALLALIARDLPPLRGVLHAAMVLEDSLLVNLDRDRIDRVLAPKLAGTWNVHVQTAACPLDFFIMFSSLSSVFGHAGQGSYAAANAFLDAMAWHRRASGLPALTVNWGYVGDAGYLARRTELGERLKRQGVLSFTTGEALALLEKAMIRERVQLSVMRVDWSRWTGLGVTGRISPRFAHLCGHVAGETGKPANCSIPGLDAISVADPTARPGLVAALLRDKMARVLGTEPDRLDENTPLLQLGIDSLMAVELRNWLEGELRVDLPIVELMRSPSLAGLAGLLAERLGPARATVSSNPLPNGSLTDGDRQHERALAVGIAEPANKWAKDVDDLSGEEVDALLVTLIGEKGYVHGR